MPDATPEESAMHVERDPPLHLDMGHPMRLPESVWNKMDSVQKEGYLRYVRGYLDALEDEKRNIWRKKHGF